MAIYETCAAKSFGPMPGPDGRGEVRECTTPTSPILQRRNCLRYRIGGNGGYYRGDRKNFVHIPPILGASTQGSLGLLSSTLLHARLAARVLGTTPRVFDNGNGSGFIHG